MRYIDGWPEEYEKLGWQRRRWGGELRALSAEQLVAEIRAEDPARQKAAIDELSARGFGEGAWPAIVTAMLDATISSSVRETLASCIWEEQHSGTHYRDMKLVESLKHADPRARLCAAWAIN